MTFLQMKDMVYRRIGDRYKARLLTSPTTFPIQDVIDEINLGARRTLMVALSHNIWWRDTTVDLSFTSAIKEIDLDDGNYTSFYPYIAITKAERTDVSPKLPIWFPAGGDYRRVVEGVADSLSAWRDYGPRLYRRGDNIIGLYTAASSAMTVTLHGIAEWTDLTTGTVDGDVATKQIPPRFHHIPCLYAAENLFGSENSPTKARTLLEIDAWEKLMRDTGEAVLDASSSTVLYAGVG